MRPRIRGSTIASRFTCLLLLVAPAAASPWNQATHAYIADRLGARAGVDDLREQWGSVGPDLFNLIFDPAVCQGWISDQTHGTVSESFMKVWDARHGGREAALAYGFVTHNQAWGADFTAHVSGRTFGQDGGYVISKAALLLKSPVSQAGASQTFEDALARLGMSPGVREMVAHGLVEYAIDIRLRNDMDPLVGRELARAARGETRGLSDLLVKAFAADYATECFGGDETVAAAALADAEARHRNDMIFLGQAISQPEPVAVRRVAGQITGVLADLLGGALPRPETAALVEAGILRAMGLCRDDYGGELEATIELVAGNLRDRGLSNVEQGRAAPAFARPSTGGAPSAGPSGSTAVLTEKLARDLAGRGFQVNDGYAMSTRTPARSSRTRRFTAASATTPSRRT